MVPHETLEALVALNAKLFAAGEHEAAYHALMAAVHLADHAADLGALAAIERAARAQAGNIDAIEPPHRLSERQATTRGQQAVFHTLQVHIQAVRNRLESQAAQRRAQSMR